MVYIPGRCIAFVELPKTASRSFFSAIGSCNLIPNSKLPDAPHATFKQYCEKYDGLVKGITVIRDPIAKLISAVNFLSFQDKFYKNNNSLKLIKSSFEKCLNENKFDISAIWLYPQYSFLLAEKPLDIFTLNSKDLFFRELGINPSLEHTNSSKKIFSKNEIIDVFGTGFIENVYAIDFKMWDMIKCSKDEVIRVENARDFILSLKGKT